MEALLSGQMVYCCQVADALWALFRLDVFRRLQILRCRNYRVSRLSVCLFSICLCACLNFSKCLSPRRSTAVSRSQTYSSAAKLHGRLITVFADRVTQVYTQQLKAEHGIGTFALDPSLTRSLYQIGSYNSCRFIHTTQQNAPLQTNFYKFKTVIPIFNNNLAFFSSGQPFSRRGRRPISRSDLRSSGHLIFNCSLAAATGLGLQTFEHLRCHGPLCFICKSLAAAGPA
ncbi:hypothetical protein J6590_006280 [Homalodisca vitripennis]|nr:hypothetical protein J6590_006280 [Homalodisca vitripennis]